jgi:phosphatidylserine/phosphatidylglycerophosphate/cardiolipin synthase-like enzyme
MTNMHADSILKPGRNCLGISGVDRTGIIFDGRDYYRAFYECALRAERTIIISGWQFDSNVKLVRGADADGAPATGLLDFLKSLCDKKPDLKVYILAWDYHLIFFMEREWTQNSTFSSAHERIFFRFDHRHAFAASQHQKFVVIDGHIAFAGGMDICAGRWDDRAHTADNPLRVDSGGRAYGAYHDLQSYHTGPVVAKLTELFKKSWKDSTGGDDLTLPPAGGEDVFHGVEFGSPIHAKTCAISRTRARSLFRIKRPVREIRRLYTDAILSAKEFIYIENQYFSSYAIYRAIVRKMKSSQAGFQIVIILPKKEGTLLERIHTGISQNRMLNSLKRVARVEAPVYIHSKLMLIDEHFLTLGSANTTNRSMGLDTELNVSWEAAGDGARAISRSLLNIRTELLTEHTGAHSQAEIKRLGKTKDLVAHLESVADRPSGKLRRLKAKRPNILSAFLRAFKLDRLIIDPEKAVIDENIISVLSVRFNSIAKRVSGFFKKKQRRDVISRASRKKR